MEEGGAERSGGLSKFLNEGVIHTLGDRESFGKSSVDIVEGCLGIRFQVITSDFDTIYVLFSTVFERGFKQHTMEVSDQIKLWSWFSDFSAPMLLLVA